MDTTMVAALLGANVVALTGIFGVLWRMDRVTVRLTTELEYLKAHISTCPLKSQWKGNENVERN